MSNEKGMIIVLLVGLIKKTFNETFNCNLVKETFNQNVFNEIFK